MEFYYKTKEAETEKAVLLGFEATNAYGDEYLAKVWLPKSQVRMLENQVVEMPAWLANSYYFEYFEVRSVWSHISLFCSEYMTN